MPRGVSAARAAQREARRVREAEIDRLLNFARLELFVVEADLVDDSTGEVRPGYRLESGVVAGVRAGDVDCRLQCLLLDNQWFGRDVPDGVVVCRHDAFASRVAAERSARIWRARFARLDAGSEG